MDIQEARKVCEGSTQSKNLVKHMIAAGAAMRALAEYFGESAEEADRWEMAGILHDIDYDETADNFPLHGKLSSGRILELGFGEDIANAVSRHPAHADNMPQTRMDWALHIVDPLTGLVVAAVLMHPSKKIAALDTGFVLSRFKEKRFAAGANRDQIALCEPKLGISLADFVGVVISGMSREAKALGL